MSDDLTLPSKSHTMRTMAVVLIPVKDAGRAKQRLRAVLTQDERTQLAWAMLTDVAAALAQARCPEAVFVVTSSTTVDSFARRQGWELLKEEIQLAESSSVDWAAAELKHRGISQVLRLPGDVPLIEPGDIDDVIEAGLRDRSCVIVPSRDGTGTNALLRSPPDAFPSRFGPDSYRLHHEEAGFRGVPLVTLPNERIAMDVDDPGDLAALLDRCSSGKTLDFLTSIRARDRLVNAANAKA